MKLSLAELSTLVATYVDENKISQSNFTETKNNIAQLADKIGKQFTLDSNYVDKLPMLDGDNLPLGQTIEEWFEDLILPIDKDNTGAHAMSPHDVTYREPSYSYDLGTKVIPVTVRSNNLEKACNNVEVFNELTAKTLKRLYDSEAAYKYDIKKELIGVLVEAIDSAMSASSVFAANTNYAVNTYLKKSNDSNTRCVVVKAIKQADALTYNTALSSGYIVELDLETEIAIPTDTASSEAFITQLKKDVEAASFISEGHSLNGNTLGVTDGLVLFIKKGIMPVMEVEALSGAFNEKYLAAPATIVVVDDFGAENVGAYAILADTRGLKVHNSYKAVRSNENGEGDFINYFLHTRNTCHYSRNTFVKVYKA